MTGKAGNCKDAKPIKIAYKSTVEIGTRKLPVAEFNSKEKLQLKLWGKN